MVVRLLVLVLLVAGAASLAVPYAPAMLDAVVADRADAPAPAARPPFAEAVLRKGPGGHVTADALVNGQRVAFLVDTGATRIVLDAATARRLGYRPSPAEFDVPVRTANGEIAVASITLGEVSIQGVSLRDVSALVAPDGALDGNLLGMSFLNRLRRVEFRDEGLVLGQ